MTLLLVVMLGFLGALLVPAVHRWAGQGVVYVAALVPLAATVYFAQQLPTLPDGEAIYETYPWVPNLGLTLSFYLDGLGLLFSLMVSAIGALICIYAGGYLEGHPHLGRFYAYILAFMAAMLGTVLAGNLLTLYVFWELTTLTSFLLIGFENEKNSARAAARQALMLTAGGGLALLVGLILLGMAAGGFEMTHLLETPGSVTQHTWYPAILTLILIGAFTKSAQFPFHFWLPRAMEAPTPVSAYLHSATMVKLGVFLLARFSPVLGGTTQWQAAVIGVGAATMFLGAYLAFFEHDLKGVLAYLTVNVLGTLVMLLGIGTELAVKAAMAYLVAHALYKGALFLVVGAVDHEAGTRDLRQLGGLWRRMPLTAFIAVLAALSMAGIPPLFGFIGKELYFEAAEKAPAFSLWLMILSVVSSVFLVAGALLIAVRPFFGKRTAQANEAHEAGLRLWLAPLVLAITGLAAGLLPNLLVKPLVEPAVAGILAEPVSMKLALWHGVTVPLMLSLTAVVGGLAVYLFRGALSALLPRATSWSFDLGYERCIAALQWTASFQTGRLQSGYLRRYVTVILVTTVALVASALVQAGHFELTPLGREVQFYEGAAVALILAGAYAAVTSTSRFKAVAALGVVGFNIAWLFQIFGAPDLAMTQIVIEALTVLLFVLAFTFLPRFTLLSSPAARARDVVIAGSVGTLIALLLLLSARTDGPPSISAYFAEHSYLQAHGRNVVNVILVDFRALDTLGEISVLSTAAVGAFALIKLVRPQHRKSDGGEP